MDNKCCDICNEHISLENEIRRGFTVYKKENGIRFLRFSCVDGLNESKLLEILRAIKEKPKFNLTLGSDIAIKYCPWCGKLLSNPL